jgi:uncharacterized protein YbjQ (UPF0145 family)
MLVLTTPTIENKNIVKYLGKVTGSEVMGESLFRNYSINLADIIGGKGGTYEKEFRKAKDKAIKQMEDEAALVGANAVVGAEFAYQTLERERSKSTMIVIIITGTAIIFEDYPTGFVAPSAQNARAQAAPLPTTPSII